jgi:probable HAF family extracellular repeat protein
MRPHTLAALALAASAGLASAQATFQGLGDLEGGGFYSEAHAVSADGRTVVGSSVTGGVGPGTYSGGFIWTSETLIQPGGIYPGAFGSCNAVSADGSTIAATSDFGPFSPFGIQANLWTPAGGCVLLGDFEGGANVVPHSFGRGVSADGSVIVGVGQSDLGDEAFRYDVATSTMTPLSSFVQSPYGAYAYAISADGRTIIGASLYTQGLLEAFRWTQAAGLVHLGFLPRNPGVPGNSVAEAISANGSVIVGESRSVNAANGGEAFRWTAAGGMQPLGDLPGGNFASWAYAVSPDGAIVVGRATIEMISPFSNSGPRAFVWDAQHGMRDLQQVLIDAGANLAGWSLTEARGIAADNRTIVGNGLNPDGFGEAWIAVLPATSQPCYPNCDQSTAAPVLNINDFICFQQQFAAGDAYANCDGSTAPPTLNINDFICFQTRFAQGCR